MKFPVAWAVLVLAVAGCAAPVSRFPTIDAGLAAEEAERQREMVIDSQMRRQARLVAVSQRLMAANADQCGARQRGLLGLVLASADLVPGDYAKTFARLYGPGDQPIVHAAIAGGPAEKAGIKRGDVITGLAGQPVTTGKAALVQMVEAGRNLTGPVAVDILRGGEKLRLEIAPARGCDYPAVLIEADVVNAFADGDRVIVTGGMMKFIESDDELALIVGHEMAHNTMGHRQKKQTNATIGNVIGAVVSAGVGINVGSVFGDIGARAYSQEFEAEADYVGVYYAARAGFDTAGAAHLWRRIALEKPLAIGLGGGTHPSTAKRFLAVEAATREVIIKGERGLALTPDLNDVAPEITPARAVPGAMAAGVGV